MKLQIADFRLQIAVAATLLAVTTLAAADHKVDLGKETVGRPPATFEPMVGTWVVAQDGADKVIMVDGRPWVASKDNPTRLLIESARKLYGTSNEELMDNAKQFAYFPVAVLRGVDNFTNGAISVKFKTIAGDADRASGILFNVKPNGDWLALRYNDTETQCHPVGIPQRRAASADPAARRRPAHRSRRSREMARAQARGRRRQHLRFARRDSRPDLRARQRASARTQQRAAQSGSVAGKQPGPTRADHGQGRPVGEDRHDQLFQRLRGQPEMTFAMWRPGDLASLAIAFILATAIAANAQPPNTATLIVRVLIRPALYYRVPRSS